MKKLLIFGAGDIAQLAHFYFEEQKKSRVEAFVVDDDYLTAKEFDGCPLIGLSELESKYPPNECDAFVAISYAQMNKVRQTKYAMLKDMGYRMVSYISPYCTCLSQNIGENCFILEDNTIQPFVEIGNNVTLWSGNHIGHHSFIGDNCFISSQVVVSGGVHIEENCFIGVNATLRDHVRIGRETLIAAGALVVKDTEPKQVLKGQPAKVAEMTSDQLKRI